MFLFTTSETISEFVFKDRLKFHKCHRVVLRQRILLCQWLNK